MRVLSMIKREKLTISRLRKSYIIFHPTPNMLDSYTDFCYAVGSNFNRRRADYGTSIAAILFSRNPVTEHPARGGGAAPFPAYAVQTA